MTRSTLDASTSTFSSGSGTTVVKLAGVAASVGSVGGGGIVLRSAVGDVRVVVAGTASSSPRPAMNTTHAAAATTSPAMLNSSLVSLWCLFSMGVMRTS